MRNLRMLLAGLALLSLTTGCVSAFEIADHSNDSEAHRKGDMWALYGKKMTEDMERDVGPETLKKWDAAVSDDVILVETVPSGNPRKHQK